MTSIKHPDLEHSEKLEGNLSLFGGSFDHTMHERNLEKTGTCVRQTFADCIVNAILLDTPT